MVICVCVCVLLWVSLQVECERVISNNVRPENACSLLAAADRANSLHLRKFCKEFVVRNFARVRQGAGKML